MGDDLPLSRMIELRRNLEQLMEQPGWQHLVGLMQEQVDALQSTVLFTPVRSVDMALEHENLKGQILGKLSISKSLEYELTNLEFDIRRLQETTEKQDDSASDSSAGGNACP